MSKFCSRGAMIAGLTMFAAFVTCAVITAAHAEHREGPYVEGFGGYAWPGNISAGGETDPEQRITLERSGEYAFGGGGGYQWANGLHVGGKIKYTRHGCDEAAGPGCADYVPGEEVETATLGALAAIGYTLDTALIVDPFAEIEAGLGYIAMDCEHRDACPTGDTGNANHADVGFMYGVCGGLRAPLTDSRSVEAIADACWNRVEGASFDGVPHPDALTAITAGLRVRVNL